VNTATALIHKYIHDFILVHGCSPKLGLQHLSACLFEGDEKDTQRAPDKINENYPNRTMIVDDIPLED